MRVTQVTADHDGYCSGGENEETYETVEFNIIVGDENRGLVERVWREFPDTDAMNELFTFRFVQWVASIDHGSGYCDYSHQCGLRHEIAIVSSEALPSTIIGTHNMSPAVCRKVTAGLRWIPYMDGFAPTRDWWYHDSCILVRHRIKLFLMINNRRGSQRLPKDVTHMICGELSNFLK